MDDLMTGADTSQEATRLQKVIHETLANAGFKLRKYQSNSTQFLQSIPKEIIQHIGTNSMEPAWSSAILGLGWNCQADTFGVRVTRSQLTHQAIITKRQLLSEVSRVFDPLGILSPFTIRAKLFIQRVWVERVGWDDVVSPQLIEDLHKYLQELPMLATIAIDRHYTPGSSVVEGLIGFCDSSERAYCAVVYAQHYSTHKKPALKFVCAKTRLAPVKNSATVPRLELQAAALLTTLMIKAQNALQVPTERVTLYSDSQVVLAWIAKPNKNWTPFVRNRTEKIATSYPSRHWQYIPSESNPADLATRGLRVSELIVSQLWFNGPENWNHLRSTATQPNLDSQTTLEIDLEMAPSPSFCSTITTTRMERSLLDRFTSYTRLLSVLGRVILFTRKWRAARPNQDKYNLNLSNPRIRARLAAIILLQVQAFPAEKSALEKGQPIHRSSPLYKLDPFVDQDGIIRVTGRLANAEYSFHKRHPIVLPKNSHFLKLYVQYLHDTFCHANKSFILSFVLAEFWVYGGAHTLVKGIINSCMVCARYRAETYSQVMGQLPAERITPSRPFTNVGIDFCGPFNSRCVGHRSLKINKIYACIYVCMVTRAIHIEVVSNLTSTNFLMSLHRFVARRGLPTKLFSDCGTNFVGAHNYLNLADQAIQSDPTTHQIHWIFNPPRAPHRGGIWEVAVKAAKSHLVRTIGTQTMNFEEYVTLFTRIEAILNSRPLCYRSSPKTGELILTPSHFLIGTLPYVLPEPETSTLPLWKRYDSLRILLHSFWKPWRADYLNMLQKKEKWNDPASNIQVGQLVLLRSDAPPGSWPYAIVKAVHPDSLGNVRTVTVKPAVGAELQRDVRHLVRLPVDVPCKEDLAGGNVATSATSAS